MNNENINTTSQVLRYFELDLRIAILIERKRVVDRVIELLKLEEDNDKVIAMIRKEFLC